MPEVAVTSVCDSIEGKERVIMSEYLNTMMAFQMYQNEKKRPYFVDKTRLLTELFPLVEQGTSYICITRPRRFGKTVMANMVSAFFGKGCHSNGLFDDLSIAGQKGYSENLNQHNVIQIDFSVVDDECSSYKEYIGTIKELLREDLHNAYSHIAFRKNGSVREDLNRIYSSTNERFLFVLDEWDAVFHMPFMTEENKKSYLLFLKGLLKDKAYVSLVYMTGILPIAKYSSGSELNMFAEYSMGTEEKFSDYFGFTEAEVDVLYQRYLVNVQEWKVTREELKEWYDGYHTKSGERLYNPRSIVLSLTNNNLGNYWTSSGPYDEIFYYIKHNVDDVRNDLALMVSGIPVKSGIREYAASSMELSTREEIFSAMVVYGFLSYEDGMVRIPNKELMDKFDEMIKKESSLGYMNQLAKESSRMLKATMTGDTDTITEILEYAHNTETPISNYNNEVELSAIVNLVYLSARESYRIEREDKAGIGYVDFIFYPNKKNEDCIILELKVDHTPEEAIQQIKDKKYALRFAGKLGEPSPYTGRILAVGISYFKETKEHQCKIEVL